MVENLRHASVVSTVRGLLTRRVSRHPDRYLQVYRIARKYQLHHVAAEIGPFTHSHIEDEGDQRARHYEPDDDHPVNFALALEELGPCFIKLGQLMSTRPDLLPDAYITALARLQGAVTPVPSERIIRTIETELKRPMSELFRSFDEKPLATASMAQVHRAVLMDGSEVAVKVQRPGVRQRIEIDIEVMRELATLATRFSRVGARLGLLQMVRELEYSLNQELDFRQEADNTRIIGRQIADFPHLTTPTVYAEYTSSRVLTLSFVHGRHLAELSEAELSAAGTSAIAEDLLSAYLKQVAVDGVFHCDPHPGNILLADDGRLALMDFGMVGRFDAGQKDHMILLLLAFSERLGERVANTYLDLVELPKGFDRRAFTQDVSALVSHYHDLSGGRMALGTALLDLTRVAQRHRTPVPTSLTLLGKTLLNLDGTIRVLSPELDPVHLVRSYMQEVMQQRVMAQFSPGRVGAWVLDMKHLVENSPRHVEMALEKLSSGQLTVRVEADTVAFEGLQKSARSLTRSMLLSSIIIAAGYVLGSVMRDRGNGRRSN